MSDTRTAVLVILDGLGDRPIKVIGGKTPLQKAKTPILDKLAAEGQSGLMDVLGPGITPGSDAAHLALFGYDYAETYPGRGPLEALGAGLPSKVGDVAFRSNFATIGPDYVVLDRRAGREFRDDEHRALEDALKELEIDGVKVHFVATVEHRGAIVLEGEGLSGEISDIDPHETGVKVLTAEPHIPEAKKTADVVNKLVKIAHERFEHLGLNEDRKKRGLPVANALLLRGPGQHAEIPTLEQKFGISSTVLAGGALYIGTARYVGMQHIAVEGQTGRIDTNFDNIVKKAIERVDAGDNYLFIHIKATDNASHDGNHSDKILAIERADEMVGKMIEKVGDNIILAVTGDHSTPVEVGEHTCDPVPILLWSNFLRSDSVDRFSEIDAAQGGLQSIQGKDVMSLLLGYAGHIEKMGA
ncbi:MAG: 2,3-bisphosphoglycerate-independent phosphoglycerate mutase [Candidatus Thorarchaeota archaeon]|jgi:2,3-bisphosphoglycerate-independent phosphoglycerate mutase